jgi:hypothetical protein
MNGRNSSIRKDEPTAQELSGGLFCCTFDEAEHLREQKKVDLLPLYPALFS